MRCNVAFIFLFHCINILGQGWRVQYTPTGNTQSSAFGIFEIAAGSYIAGGIAADSANVLNRLSLMGLGSEGQLLWQKKYNYYNNAATSRCFYKSNNNLYCTCILKGNNNELKGALVKFDLSGNILWEKVYSDASCQVAPWAMSASVDGGFLLTGAFSTPDTLFCMLLKTDSNGNELWRKKIKNMSHPYAQQGNVVLQDTISKKILIAGIKYTDNYYAGYTSDIVLIMDSLGAELEERNYINNGGISDLIQTKDSNFLIIGSEVDSVISEDWVWNKSFAVKFGLSAFQPIWQIRHFGKIATALNEFGASVSLSNGDILLGGVEDTNLITKARISKIDASGNILWNRYYEYANGANLFVMLLSGISTTSDDGFVVALHKDSHSPFMFTKFDSYGCDSTLAYCEANYTVGFKETAIADGLLSVFPNPAVDYLTIKYETERRKVLHIGLYDALGRLVCETDLTAGVTQQMSLLNLPGGTYMLRAHDGKNTVYNSRIVCIH